MLKLLQFVDWRW